MYMYMQWDFWYTVPFINGNFFFLMRKSRTVNLRLCTFMIHSVSVLFAFSYIEYLGGIYRGISDSLLDSPWQFCAEASEISIHFTLHDCRIHWISLHYQN